MDDAFEAVLGQHDRHAEVVDEAMDGREDVLCRDRVQR